MVILVAMVNPKAKVTTRTFEILVSSKSMVMLVTMVPLKVKLTTGTFETLVIKVIMVTN